MYFSLHVISQPLQIVALLLYIITIFDVLSVKYNLRTKEPLPKRLDNLDEFSLMRARVACRSFQNRTLSPEHHQELMAYVQNYNGVKADNFSDNPVRFEYINAPLTVWPVVGAQEFLVAIVEKEYNKKSVLDVGRNLQHIVHYATKMGLATCWIGPGADQTSIVKHLGDRFDTDNEHIICICAIGYTSIFKPFALRMMSVFQHKRRPLNELFFTDKSFSSTCNVEKAPYTELERTYEVCQWAPSSFNGQTTKCVLHDDTNTITQADFYSETASKYYAPVALGIWCANWEIGTKSLGITGHFRVQNSLINETLPRYHVSWVKD